MPKMTASHARKPALDARHLRAKVEEAFGVSSNTLRRDGRAPLVFVGRKLAEATSYSAGTSLWYEIAAYGGDKGYAAAIKVFKKRSPSRIASWRSAFPVSKASCATWKSMTPPSTFRSRTR